MGAQKTFLTALLAFALACSTLTSERALAQTTPASPLAAVDCKMAVVASVPLATNADGTTSYAAYVLRDVPEPASGHLWIDTTAGPFMAPFRLDDVAGFPTFRLPSSSRIRGIFVADRDSPKTMCAIAHAWVPTQPQPDANHTAMILRHVPDAAAIATAEPITDPASACGERSALPRTLRVVAPEAPPIAVRQGITGIVRVEVSLASDSSIDSLRISASPSAILNQAALASARSSTYETAFKNCEAVASQYLFRVEFTRRY